MLDTPKSSHISEWMVLTVEWGNAAFERCREPLYQRKFLIPCGLLAADVAAKHLHPRLQLVAGLDQIGLVQDHMGRHKHNQLRARMHFALAAEQSADPGQVHQPGDAVDRVGDRVGDGSAYS